MPSRHSRALGVALIALSLARWPATVVLASPGWISAVNPWYAILALQILAEAMFWCGVWMIGRGRWRELMARVAASRLARAALVKPHRTSESA